MPARTVTHSPTTQNRTEIVLTGQRTDPKGWQPFEKTLYAQDVVQAEKAKKLYPALRGAKVTVVRNIGKRTRHNA